MSVSFQKGKQFLTVTHTLDTPTEPNLPPLGKRIVNFGRAIVRTGVSVVSGNPLKVSPETMEKRRAICEACEFYRASDGRCSRCGCHSSPRGIVASKIELFAEFCPEAKWFRGDFSELSEAAKRLQKRQ